MKVATKIVSVGNGFGVEIPQKFLEIFRIILGDVITLSNILLKKNLKKKE